jgi:hypothetical protein
MDFSDNLKGLTARAAKLQSQLKTEEATKQALILPFFSALGYDIFNPMEFQPEFTADIGLKQGEKVDYAVLQDGKPVILVECKTVTDKLNKADSQLFRYFHTTTARFGILTNGLDYKFYTDIEQKNRMDEKPFLNINILNIKEQDIIELKKFHKSVFDVNQIFSTASELKYLNEIKAILSSELEFTSEEFAKYFINSVYPGRATANVVKQFQSIVKKALNQFTSEIVSARIKSVLDKEKETEKAEAEKETEGKLIETTDEEMEAFYIVKGILRQAIDGNRIFNRDVQSYFSVLIDDSNRKPICRLYLTETKKCIGIMDAGKREIRYDLTTLDDIYKYTEQLLAAVKIYQ